VNVAGSVEKKAPRDNEAPLPPGRPSFRQVYDSQFAYVWKTVRRLGIREAEQEDAAHEVFLVVLRRLDQYDPARPLRPWLFGIALRVVSSYQRAVRARHEVVMESAGSIEVADPGAGAEEQALRSEKQRLVLEALEHVEIGRRAVFVLHEIDQFAMPEIAQALGIPLNTAYSRLRLARAEFAAAAQRMAVQRGDA
jgi:RNA polymerase sigma-70 factor, ECF subfamily